MGRARVVIEAEEAGKCGWKLEDRVTLAKVKTMLSVAGGLAHGKD